jgi:hypothetical protein
MKHHYLKVYTTCLRQIHLFFSCSLLLFPIILQAQSVTVQQAPGYLLPLQNFGTMPVSRTSALQSFLVSGDNLTASVTVAPPSGFEIRTGSNAFAAASLSLPPTGSTLAATTVDIRFAPVPSSSRPDGTGAYAEDVVVSTPSGASTAVEGVPVMGVAPAGPYVFIDSALAFGAVSQSGSGQVLTFAVGGGNLGSTPLTVSTALTGTTASGSIQLRNPAVAGSQFASSLTLTPVGGQVAQTMLEARIVGPIPGSSNFTGNIRVASGAAVAAPDNVIQVTAYNPFTGANTSSTFTVSTPVSTPITPGYPNGGQPLKPFNTVPERASASQALVVSGSFLINGILVQAPNNFQVSLSKTFPGLGNGAAGTTTGNSLTIPAVDGTIRNDTVYMRYVPLVAGTESGTGIMFDSAPSTSIATIVQANSIGITELGSLYRPEGPLVIGLNVRTAPQRLHIHAELLRNPLRLAVSGESVGALGNPNGYAQFQISADGLTYTDPTSPSTAFIQLTPNPVTNTIDQDIYVVYTPTRVGAALAVLQYLTPDVTAAPANTATTLTSSLAGLDANKLRGIAIDVEPTRATPFTAGRNVGAASAAIAFTPDNGLSGYGEFHIVLISTSATLTIPDVLPVDGTDYNAGNGAYGSAGQSTLRDSQNNTYYVVFSGGAPTATITGLSPSTNYYAYVFDYNSTNLNTTTFINNAENYRIPAQTTVLGTLLPGTVPLPVELSAFTASAAGATAVQAAWSTASETDNDYFNVERSVDGKAFTTVGTLSGAGTSSRSHSYSFLDVTLPAQVNTLYYRLRQVNTNGRATYSPVRVVILNEEDFVAQLQAYPNPAHEVVHLRIRGPIPAAPLQVFDAMGRLIRTTQLSPTDSDPRLSLTDFPAGLYILRCGTLTQRLTVH